MGPVAFVTLCLLGCLVCSPALPAPLSAAARATSCLCNWQSYDGHCYGYFREARTWQQAKAACQEYGEGTHLVSIHSDGENNMLTQYVKQFHKTEPVWIGLSDPAHNRGWRWADGSLFNFTAWTKGQPDPPSKNEHCVVLNAPGFNKWDDYPCEKKFPFICEQGANGGKLAARGSPQHPGRE